MLKAFLFFLLPVAVPVAALAAGLSAPAGPVVLTVTGAGIVTNAPGRAELDMAMLARLPQHVIETSAPWTEGRIVRYEGPLMRDVMAMVGAVGTSAAITATDDYFAEIPFSDFGDNGPILATRRDGKPMPDDDQGPLFVIYDYDSDPDLDTQTYHDRSVWSVSTIEIVD